MRSERVIGRERERERENKGEMKDGRGDWLKGRVRERNGFKVTNDAMRNGGL